MKTDWEIILDALEAGTRRSAYPENGSWSADPEVKQQILHAFREGKLTTFKGFVDKHNLLPQEFTPERGVRVVPGGTAVRRGAFVAPGVIIMPPSYVNTGAYVDEGTMIDSHVLVGSCAQVGKRVHLSAGVQLGGVLEPVGQTPVIIEDDVFIGAGSIVVEGIRVKKGAVLAPGVTLSRGIRVYDTVHERKLDRGEDIPERAVVVPGSRPVKGSIWAGSEGIQIQCAVIVKYRDAGSDTSLELEAALR